MADVEATPGREDLDDDPARLVWGVMRPAVEVEVPGLEVWGGLEGVVPPVLVPGTAGD